MLDRVVETAGAHGYLPLLARAKAALQSSREVVVSADEIRPFPDQPRRYFSEDSIARLMESIDASGQTTAGLIRENAGQTRYELIDGERRWRAVRMIPAERRPLYVARLIEADDDVVRYLISGIANFNREGHTPLETADTIDRLMSYALPMREIAALLGISEHWGYQMHGLKNLADNVRCMMDPHLPRARRLPVTAAVEISKVSHKLQLGLAQRVLSRSISLGDLRVEAVRVAKKSSTYVRERTVPRDERWRLFRRKVGGLEVFAADAQRVVQLPEVREFAAERTRAERRELAARLRNVRTSVDEIIRALEEVV